MISHKLLAVAAALSVITVSVPASATYSWGSSSGGTKPCKKNCSTSTSGNTTSGNTTSGNTTSGNTTSGNTTSGNTTSGNTTSGGTAVPEPGMLAMFGAGLLGLGLARRRRRAQA